MVGVDGRSCPTQILLPDDVGCSAEAFAWVSPPRSWLMLSTCAPAFLPPILSSSLVQDADYRAHAGVLLHLHGDLPPRHRQVQAVKDAEPLQGGGASEPALFCAGPSTKRGGGGG